jgi:hypothetical protein
MRPHVGVLTAALLMMPILAWAAPPAGWFLTGKDPTSYAIETDTAVFHEGKSSARLASIRSPVGFGTLMQNFDASDYLGKRLQLSAYVKADKVKNWAGLWMRVDGANPNSPLAFDNMQGRPVRGTQDWKRYEIVLDIGPDAKAIAFGILLDDEGTVWLDDVQFKIVDNTVPVTGGGAAAAKQPANLGLEK